MEGGMAVQQRNKQESCKSALMRTTGHTTMSSKKKVYSGYKYEVYIQGNNARTYYATAVCSSQGISFNGVIETTHKSNRNGFIYREGRKKRSIEKKTYKKGAPNKKSYKKATLNKNLQKMYRVRAIPTNNIKNLVGMSVELRECNSEKKNSLHRENMIVYGKIISANRISPSPYIVGTPPGTEGLPPIDE